MIGSTLATILEFDEQIFAGNSTLVANLSNAPQVRAANTYYLNFTDEACATTLLYASEALPDLSAQLGVDPAALRNITNSPRAVAATSDFLRAFNLTADQLDNAAAVVGELTASFAVSGSAGALDPSVIGGVLGAGSSDAVAGALGALGALGLGGVGGGPNATAQSLLVDLAYAEIAAPLGLRRSPMLDRAIAGVIQDPSSGDAWGSLLDVRPRRYPRPGPLPPRSSVPHLRPHAPLLSPGLPRLPPPQRLRRRLRLGPRLQRPDPGPHPRRVHPLPPPRPGALPPERGHLGALPGASPRLAATPLLSSSGMNAALTPSINTVPSQTLKGEVGVNLLGNIVELGGVAFAPDSPAVRAVASRMLNQSSLFSAHYAGVRAGAAAACEPASALLHYRIS